MDWHQRYVQQARWTHDLRTYLFEQAGLNTASSVLEVGCGTGAILSEIPAQGALHGLDLDAGALAQCRVHAPSATLVQGNALQLPYASQSFDIVYCHFLLLWVQDPIQALLEMSRVARSGAHILAFAEPDYAARVDEPRELAPLGQWQADSLRRQGADPALGAQLADLFFRAGIKINETGTIRSAESASSPEDWETEWAVIEADLEDLVPNDKLQEMKQLDRQARLRGSRKRHVPTYFAWGQV
jgi:ubiquinone/menaquinone biosynthesis C-methylase UbiE